MHMTVFYGYRFILNFYFRIIFWNCSDLGVFCFAFYALYFLKRSFHSSFHLLYVFSVFNDTLFCLNLNFFFLYYFLAKTGHCNSTLSIQMGLTLLIDRTVLIYWCNSLHRLYIYTLDYNTRDSFKETISYAIWKFSGEKTVTRTST